MKDVATMDPPPLDLASAARRAPTQTGAGLPRPDPILAQVLWILGPPTLFSLVGVVVIPALGIGSPILVPFGLAAPAAFAVLIVMAVREQLPGTRSTNTNASRGRTPTSPLSPRRAARRNRTTADATTRCPACRHDLRDMDARLCPRCGHIA